jgi:hypothetical protein
LIYNSCWAEHLQHIDIDLNALCTHRLHLKHSKCLFGAISVAYLGHVIFADGVAMDPDKITAVATWLTLRSARALRGFLGLVGYYRKFIQDFGIIVVPLTRLLRRDAFARDEEAETAWDSCSKCQTSSRASRWTATPPARGSVIVLLGARRNLGDDP